MEDLVEKLKMESILTDEEFIALLQTEDSVTRAKLFGAAQEAVTVLFKRVIQVQGVLEFTNHCPKNCLYCQLRSENTVLPRFRLNWEQIKGACQEGYDLGMRYLILESGEDQYYTDMIMCNLLTNLKKQFPEVKLGLALEERSKASYQRMFKAEAQGYLLRYETADPLHFSKLHPPAQALSTKIDCYNDAKAIGYTMDTGFLVGAPFETPEYLARSLTLLQELSPKAISLVPFIPRDNTPFRQEKRASLEEFLRLIAIVRIMFPRADITAPPEVNKINAQGQLLSVLSGANVVRVPLEPPEEPGALKNDSRQKLFHTLEMLYTYLDTREYTMVVD